VADLFSSVTFSEPCIVIYQRNKNKKKCTILHECFNLIIVSSKFDVQVAVYRDKFLE